MSNRKRKKSLIKKIVFKKKVGRPKKTKGVSLFKRINKIDVSETEKFRKLEASKSRIDKNSKISSIIVSSSKTGVNFSIEGYRNIESEVYEPTIFHINVFTEYEAWIMCADFDQSDVRFSSESARCQCMAVSCASLCFMQTKPIIFRIQKDLESREHTFPNWSKTDLNVIVEQGNHLHRISKLQKQNTKDYLKFEEVFPYIKINEKIYHFKQNLEINDECTLPKLIAAIEHFSNNGVQKAIFTRHVVSISVMFSDGKFICFDSHEKTLDGNLLNETFKDSSVVLCINKTIVGLAHQLMNNSGCKLRIGWNLTDVRFSLIAVEVNQFKSTEHKAEYLKIKRILESQSDKQNRLADQRKRNTTQQLHVVEHAQQVQLTVVPETPDQAEKRLKDARELSRILRKSETPDQSTKRLAEQVQRSKRNRNLEDSSQHSQRLDDMRIRKKVQKEISVSKGKHTKDVLEFMSIRCVFSSKNNISDFVKKVLPETDQPNLEVECLVKKVFHYRNTTLNNFCKYVLTLKEKFLLIKLKADSSTDIDTKFAALFGQSLHTKSSESYFANASYDAAKQFPPMTLSKTGKIADSFCYDSNTFNRWTCNDHCNLEKPAASSRCYWIAYVFVELKPDEIQAYFENIDICSNNQKSNQRNVCKKKCKCGEEDCIHSAFENQRKERLGHPEVCSKKVDNCYSILLFFRRMSPHFPFMRQVVKLIYTIRKELTKLRHLSRVLEKGELSELKAVCAKIQVGMHTFTTNALPFFEENEIYDHFASGFRALRKKDSDWPIQVCMSCRKLCPKSDMHEVINKRNEKLNFMELLTNYYSCNRRDENSSEAKELCTYCYRKLKKDEMPPTCILNKLDFGAVPEEIKDLNEFERILIQRAKAFQVIVRMNTVSGGHKRNRANESIKKIKGCAFHLPLPLENTLQKLPDATQAIVCNQELLILVRGIPSKTNQIWQSYVDVRKVYDALLWLKANNPLYKEIVLPNEVDTLLANVKINEYALRENENQKNESIGESMVADCDSDNEMVVSDDEEHFVQAEREIKMLTQKDINDEFYENLTIYPLIESRLNAKSTKIYQFLKIFDENINNRDINLDLKCFPYLFCEGKNGQGEYRNPHLQSAEFAKLLMRSSDPRFRTDQQFLFYLLNQANIRQLNAGIFHKLNITRSTKNLNAKKFMEMIQNNEIESNLKTIFGRLRGSKQFWKKPQNDLNCMTAHYGPATFFLTLSPSEYDWDDLHECYCAIYNVKKNTRTLRNFIASDPVIASLFIEMKFRATLAFLLSDSHPLGEIAHYGWRREYQSRGLQHFHIMIWVKYAPIIGKSSEEDIAEFIIKYITCRIPNKESFPTLHQRVTKYQEHKHNAYCMRTKRSKNGRTTKVCRFGFGRKMTDELVLHGVAQSIHGRRKLKKTRLYDLPRNESEKNTNDYNAAVLLAWCGNMDIQFIGEHSSSLTTYIMKYTTKPEKSATEEFSEVLQNKSAVSNLWSFGMRALNNRECGALEAADTLLQMPLFGTDSQTVIRWVDVSIQRARKVKGKAILDQMQDDDEDIFCPSWVDVHYPKRPEQLENFCLYDFLRWYDIVNKKPKDVIMHYSYGSKFLRKRKIPYLINHFKFNLKKEPESYYHSLLLLFRPWCNAEDLKCGLDTYENAFLACSEDLLHLMRYHEKLQEIELAREELRKELDMLMAEGENNTNDKNEEEIDEIIGFENTVGNELNDINALVRNVNDVSLKYQVSQMNTDQRRIFDEVIESVSKYCAELDAAQSSTSLKNPQIVPNNVLRKFVSGVGGTGKSFLINVIRRYISEVLNKDVVVAAPTGIAAFNVNGLTLHRLLQLPIEHDGIFKYKPLSDIQLQNLRNDLKNCVLFLIDETSMVSNLMLAFINQRLCEIYDTFQAEDGWFGRLNIILFGDLLQLQPVIGELPFVSMSRKVHNKYFDSLASTNLWQELFSYEELPQNVRQQNDQIYAQALTEIRLGIVSDSTEKLLRSREMNLNATSIEECLNELTAYIVTLPTSNICLFATRQQCSVLNLAMLSKIDSPKIPLKAHDNIEARTDKQREAAKKILKKWSEQKKSTLTAGLEEVIDLKLGAKVMLLKNIEISSGLVNGSIGILKKIHRGIMSDQRIEKLTILFHCGEREIDPIKTVIPLSNGAQVTRTQFPISLAYAITIHKSQGLTVSSCVVDIGESIFSKGQSYVALSRVKSLDGLHILNFNPRSIEAKNSAIVEYNRLRSTYRPELYSIQPGSVINQFTSDRNIYFQRRLHGIIEPSDQPVLQNQTIIVNRLRGLINGNQACYANAAFQCLLNIRCVEKSTLNAVDSVFKKLVIKYIEPNARGCLNLSKLRSLYYTDLNAQQDTSEFLRLLLEGHDNLRDLCSFDQTTLTNCSSCSYGHSRREKDVMYSLVIPSRNPGSVCTMSQLLNFNLNINDWTIIKGSVCENCRSPLKTKVIADNFNQIVIFVLQLMDHNKQKITNFKLRDVARNEIEVENKKYVFSGAVFHHGDSLRSGHYTAFLQDGRNLFKADDTVIQKRRWPNNSKDLYEIFYIRK